MTPSGREEAGSWNDIRVVYLAPKDVLIARVARNCMMHLCEALAILGADVELISLRVATVASEPTRTRSIWEVFGIDHRFRVTMIPTLLRQERMGGRVARVVILAYRLLVYPFYALVAGRREGAGGRRPRRTLFYSRNYGCIAGALPLRKLLGERARLVLELHLPPRGPLQRRLVRSADGVACQSAALHALMTREGLVREGNSIARHTGYSPRMVERVRVSRGEARERLGWDPSVRIACYTGKVVWGSGEIEHIVRMAEHLADDGVRVVIVGGRPDQVDLWRAEVARRGAGNVEFVGFVAPSDVMVYQMAADVLLLYYEAGIPLNDYRSPGKLFEYMASGTPAVVADYPSIREVVRDGRNGLIVPPERPDLLAAAVSRITRDPELAGALAAQAGTDVTSFTWTATARATLALADRLWSPEYRLGG